MTNTARFTNINFLNARVDGPDSSMEKLAQLHADIEARVIAIRGDNPDWLCRSGCDNCCRRLAEIPRLTAAEWDLFRTGLALLPLERLRELAQDIAALAGQSLRPIVCPLLDQPTGTCLVYACRPAACRTYGFYVQRGLGLYCKDIEARVAAGDWAEVTWGNQDAIDSRLSCLGDSRDLTEWFAQWKQEGMVT